VDGGHLLLDFEAVVGQGAGDVEELARDDVAYSADAGEGEDADEGDGEDAGNSLGFKAADGGGQKKCQGKGEGERDEEIPCEVEDEYGDREEKKRFNFGELGGS
jgi:hypothetical protein